MFKDKLNYKIINLSALMLLLYIGVSNISIWWGLLSKIISILSPFIIGFSFAYAFTPLVKWLQKKGINKTFSIIIVVFGIIFIILALLAITLPMLYDQ